MPQILDNIELKLTDALKGQFSHAQQADFCVGYFNLNGWGEIATAIEQWESGKVCRLLVGMNSGIEGELRQHYLDPAADNLANTSPDTKKVRTRRDSALAGFVKQLDFARPSRTREMSLLSLLHQLKAGKLEVRLFLRYSLHAKLYLLHFNDGVIPRKGFVGSSNLTLAGLHRQGELNIDVPDEDATEKLSKWFDARWEDKFAFDISKELIALIENSWITLRDPYTLYMRVVYFLARQQISIPPASSGVELLDFQEIAVRRAMNLLSSRRGAVIGDVVGLGKTWVACSVVKRWEQMHGSARTLIVCPARLTAMWKGEIDRFKIDATVLSMGKLDQLPRNYSPDVVIVDESHNFRNDNSERYKLLHAFLTEARPDSKVLLLSATLYSKAQSDIYNQLRLFVEPTEPLGRMPKRLMDDLGVSSVVFAQRFSAPATSLQAFRKSEHPEDWQSLLELFLIRRTRGHVKEHFAQKKADGNYYLTFPDGREVPFPTRKPEALQFAFDTSDRNDAYAQLLNEQMVDAINDLTLARYALSEYIPHAPSDDAEAKKIIDDLSRVQGRLRGFTRANFLKRLESSGAAFRVTLLRFLQRNCLFVYAIDNDLYFPIGPADSSLLSEFDDLDLEDIFADSATDHGISEADTIQSYLDLAPEVYDLYREKANSVRWLSVRYVDSQLRKDLMQDCEIIVGCLQRASRWSPVRDNKYAKLLELLKDTYPKDKVLVFSQFADTILSLQAYLQGAGLSGVEAVTGNTNDVQGAVQRFSPRSNSIAGGQLSAGRPLPEIRVLLTTDTLSEGQNLQDAHIVVNFDLPWTVIRLIQRAGRVDRLGQSSLIIRCISFMPGDNIEKMLNLRAKVIERLQQNRKILGTDEIFFPESERAKTIEIYANVEGSLDDDNEEEVADAFTLASDLWAQAVSVDPTLEERITALPQQVRTVMPRPARGKTGMVGYYHYAQDSERDSFLMVDTDGRSIQLNAAELLDVIRATPDTPTGEASNKHFKLINALDAERKVLLNAASSGFPDAIYRSLHTALGKAFKAQDSGGLMPEEMITSLQRIQTDLKRGYYLKQYIHVQLKNKLKRESPSEIAEYIYACYQSGGVFVPKDSHYYEQQLVCVFEI